MGRLIMAEGDVYKSKSFGLFTIIQYTNCKNVKIRFHNTGKTKISSTTHIYEGVVKDNYAPIVCGVGFIGNGKYKAGTSVYYRWISMLQRCYDPESKKYIPNMNVEPKWLEFQKFAVWYEKQCKLLGFKFGGNDHFVVLDPNKTTYSPRTCMLKKEYGSNKKEWKFRAPDGEDITVYGLAEWCRENKFSYYGFRCLGLGKSQQYKGYTAR